MKREVCAHRRGNRSNKLKRVDGRRRGKASVSFNAGHLKANGHD